MSKPHKNDPSGVPTRPVLGPDDEVVHVPKGQSKLRFLLTLGLMLFVLVIFVVGDQLMSTFGGGPSRGGDYMTWEHPTAGIQRLQYPDFVDAKRDIDDFYRAQGKSSGRDQTDDENITYLLITDRLAREAGISIPDSELRRVLREGQPGLVEPYFNKENYLAALKSAEVAPQRFEETLRWLMRVTRYDMLIAFALGTPDPARVESDWKTQHKEYAFDLAGVGREDMRHEAELEAPDDATLAVWFDGLADQERRSLFGEHYSPERTSAALLSWTPGGALPQGLLDRFPLPEGSDPAVLGRTYYDSYMQARFRRPDASVPEDTGDEAAAAADLQDKLYLPYEEVAATAGDEARVRDALNRLLADLRARLAAGETIDLAALAAELGLVHESDGLPRSRDEWLEWGDAGLADALAFTGPEGLTRTVGVGAKRLWVARVLERVSSEPPPFAGVAAEARKAWIDRRAGEMGLEKLEGVYKSLLASAGKTPEEGAEPPPFVDSTNEDFTAALAAAGLTAQHQEWFDPARQAGDESAVSDAERYLRDNFYPEAPLFALTAGQVAAPAVGMDGERAWLVRSQGSRDPERVDMRPSEYVGLRQGALFGDANKVYMRLHAADELAARFKVQYPGREAEEE
jgi:hypothetical protein